MLSNAKHLLAGYALSTVIAREHSDRGNLSQYVMLSNAKHLLAGYTLSTVIARLGTSRGNPTLLIANYSLLII